jgi:hypothetical protein
VAGARELRMRKPMWENWEHPPAGPASTARRRAQAILAGCPKSILLVGPERSEEFANAMRLMCRGHKIVAVNPRETRASRAFESAGGTFVRARIEELSPACGHFDLVLENYPYPSGRNYVPPRPFALARLSRLASCGRWILLTESIRFATLLRAVVEHDDDLRGMFRVSLVPISTDAAPPSHYPPIDSRFQLMFDRVG